ncbi:uncharacterized protein ISCGN_001206 [Ixodes scapularis]
MKLHSSSEKVSGETEVGVGLRGYAAHVTTSPSAGYAHIPPKHYRHNSGPATKPNGLTFPLWQHSFAGLLICVGTEWFVQYAVLLSGDIALNPGPLHYTCGRCSKGVRDNQAALCCDRCEVWFHRTCVYVPLNQYRRLGACEDTWLCFGCSFPGFTDDFFDVPVVGAASTPLNQPPTDPVFTSTAVSQPAIPAPVTPSTNPGSKRVLSVWFSNLRSVKNKLPEFQVLVASEPSTIFAACETWLDSSMYDGQLVDTTRHTVYRSDRSGHGGGVMIVVPRLLHSRRRPDLEADDLEAIFVEVSHQTGKTLICCVYCPPVTRASSYNLLHHSLQQVKPQTYTNVCVVGDFNAHIDWNDLAAPIPSGPPDDQLLDVMETSGYIQLCGEASYVSHNQNASFLDLVFASNPSLEFCSSVWSPRQVAAIASLESVYNGARPTLSCVVNHHRS